MVVVVVEVVVETVAGKVLALTLCASVLAATVSITAVKAAAVSGRNTVAVPNTDQAETALPYLPVKYLLWECTLSQGKAANLKSYMMDRIVHSERKRELHATKSGVSIWSFRHVQVLDAG